MSKNSIATTLDEEKSKSFAEYLQDILTLDFLRKNKPKISVLRLDGVIGKVGGFRSKGLSIDSVNELIEKSFEDSKTKAVCIIINSPGGSPVQSELIASRIINLSKEKNIPVYGFIEDVAASGGYWLACAASEIYASKSSIVGSIGVISAGFGFPEMIKKIGVQRRVYTSGNNKSVLDPFSPEKEEDINLIKSVQHEIHEHFINYVKSRRGGKLTQNDEIIFNGKFWTGQVAEDYGLVDGIDNFYNFIKRKFGDDVKIEYISPKQSWFKKKFGISSKDFAKDVADEVKLSLNDISISSKYDLY